MTSQNASVHPAIEYLAHQNPRPGQIDMIVEANKSLSNGGFHLAAAPTGIGKTAAALAAALEVARKSAVAKKIFFLTSRQSQHRIVVTIRIHISGANTDVKYACFRLADFGQFLHDGDNTYPREL